MDDPRRDPHQRATRTMSAEGNVQNLERDPAEQLALQLKHIREHAAAYRGRVEEMLRELFAAYIDPPQAYQRNTYVLQRFGERLPRASLTASTHTEALLEFGRRYGPAAPDEVRRVR